MSLLSSLVRAQGELPTWLIIGEVVILPEHSLYY